MNKVFLHGRLAKDISTTDNGAYKTSIAVNRYKEGADFINLVAFKKTGELMFAHLRKGSEVLVEGKIQTGSYKKKDGTTVYTTDVIVDSFEFCGKKEDVVADPVDEFVPTEKIPEEFITVEADNPEGLPFV